MTVRKGKRCLRHLRNVLGEIVPDRIVHVPEVTWKYLFSLCLAQSFVSHFLKVYLSTGWAGMYLQYFPAFILLKLLWYFCHTFGYRGKINVSSFFAKCQSHCTFKNWEIKPCLQCTYIEYKKCIQEIPRWCCSALKPNSWIFNFVEGVSGHKILRVLRLEDSIYNVCIKNQFQTTFVWGGGLKFVNRSDCEY